MVALFMIMTIVFYGKEFYHQNFLKRFINRSSSKSVYFYCVGDDAVLYDEEWARRLRDEYEEQNIVENMEEYIEKMKSNQVKINKIGFLIPDRSKADSMYYKIHDYIYIYILL